jgi:hypothetical protein
LTSMLESDLEWLAIPHASNRIERSSRSENDLYRLGFEALTPQYIRSIFGFQQ